MGIAVFSRSPAIGVIASVNSTSGSLAVVRTIWQALTARFRPARASPTPAPFLLAAAARRLVPGVLKASVPAHTATKAAAAQALHTGTGGQKQCQTVVKASSPRRLKVIRELEAGISPSCAGRMVISGRMADVCAELDRLARKESLIQAE